MKVTVIGAGAAGLSAAIVLKGIGNNTDVTILERARADEAPGLGIALLPFSLEMIKMKGFAAYADKFRPVGRMQEVFAGQTGKPDVVRKSRMQDTQYTGVKRAVLLAYLKEAALAAGVRIAYDSDITEDRVRAEKAASDLLIGADGAGSVVRSAFAKEFSPRVTDAKSRYAWLELEGGLDHFIFGYMYMAGKGLIRITAYPHSATGSSAIITHSLGLTKHFDAPDMVDAEGNISAKGLAEMNDIFASGLRGKRLVGGSRWRTFHATTCRAAAFDNVALVGDAYATLFYETGWGTSSAIQAASILGHALVQAKTPVEGLAIYDKKCVEISRGAVIATTKTMREVDGQATKFFQAGPAKFLEMGNA